MENLPWIVLIETLLIGLIVILIAAAIEEKEFSKFLFYFSLQS